MTIAKRRGDTTERDVNSRPFEGSFPTAPFTVLVDMDSVIADWDVTFREHTADLVNDLPAGYYDNPTFNLFENLEQDLIDEVLSRMNRPGFYREIPPIAGAREALNKMLDNGINVRIATSPWLSNPTCCDDKVWWNGHHLGDRFPERTQITRDKTGLLGDILFDDKPDVLGEFTPVFEHVYFSQRYNKHRTDHRRIDNWTDGSWEDLVYTAWADKQKLLTAA